jgi:hypothetical protein
LEINSKDSLSIFVEVTASQDENILTFDSLVFECNGVVKDVKLIAPSKNAVILDNYTLERSSEFDSVRPYLIFGDLHIPENVKLTIKEGATLYFHSGANLQVEGELSCEGTLRSPVTLRGDRFDAIEDELGTPYDYMPGQWGGVYLYNSDVEHKFNHTVVRGGTMGIVLYGASHVKPSVSVENSVIHSMSDFGLYSINGNITIVNTEISNCGTSCLYMIGGYLKMAHCTVANYYAYGMRTNSAVVISNAGYADGEILSLPVTSATIENSIVFGNYSKELTLSDDTTRSAAFNVTVSRSLIKSKRIDSPVFVNTLWSKAMNDEGYDVVFMRTVYDADGYYDFSLDSLSMARDVANKEVAMFYPFDMKEVSRIDDYGPDLGAYERR